MPALLQACCIRLWYSRRWWDIAKRQFLHFRAVLVHSKVRAVWRSSALKCHFVFVIFMYWMHECTWDLSLTVRWSTSSFSFPLCFDINTCLNYVATLYFQQDNVVLLNCLLGLQKMELIFKLHKESCHKIHFLQLFWESLISFYSMPATFFIAQGQT